MLIHLQSSQLILINFAHWRAINNSEPVVIVIRG